MAGPIDFSWEDILPDYNLPGDVIVSIFSNLSVESLLKLKAVNKAWRSLISSPRFREIHLHRQSLISNNLLISFGEEECGFGVVANNHDKNNNSDSDVDSDVLILDSSILFSSDESSSDEVSSDDEVSSEKAVYIWILDSCNGLVCVADSGRLILWNPATRKSRSLELPNKGGYHLSLMTLGLCYVEDTCDFKIVGWNDCCHGLVKTPSLFVYSLSSDSWERVDYDAKKAPVTLTTPTFMSGCMHWLMYSGRSKYVMVAFNVRDGVISCFGVPDDCGRHSKSVKRTLVIRGCLSIVILYDYEETENKFEVWVMEEYGVEGSWVKRFTFQWLTPHVIIPLIPWNDREIVFKSRNEDPATRILTFYDPFSKMKYRLEFKSFKIGQVFKYVESLASVEAEAGKAPF